MYRRLIVIAAGVSLAAAALTAQESAGGKLDYAMYSKIRDEGLNHSQAMDHVSWLADVYGPRLQGSPAMRQAAEWVMKKLTGWGVTSVHEEKWPFGKGWGLQRFSANMIEPQVLPLIGVPRSWTPGTAGTITADVTRADIHSEADFAKFRGHLAGKIVLTQPVREVKTLEGIIVQRWTEPLLAEAMTMPIPSGPPPPAEGAPRGPSLADKIQQFFADEHVAATFDRGSDASIVAGRQPDVLANAADRRRHDFPERRRRTREQSRQPGAVRDARGRALQPHAAHSRQGNSGKSGTECPDAVLRRDGRQRRECVRRSARQRSKRRVRAARRTPR